MNTLARSIRNDRIVALRTRGLPMVEIAREVGLTERQCRRVLRERLGNEDERRGAPGRVEDEQASASATELLDMLQVHLGELKQIALDLSDPYSLSAAFKIELAARQAEGAIAGLRARAHELLAATTADQSGDHGSG
jgi:transposase-like protein